MKRLAAAIGCLLVALGIAASAQAHPLGNFSVNHLDQVRISSGTVTVRYILDQAEIPTFQERGLRDPQILVGKQAEVARRLSLTVNRRPVPLIEQPGALISHPPGQGGLPLTRVELTLTAAIPPRGSVAISDQTFPGRVGWKAIVVAPGQRTSVRSTAPTGDPTGGLRHYPTNLLTSPLDQRTATFTVAPGDGTLLAPRGVGEAQTTTTNRAGDGFAGVFSDAANGKGVLLLLLLAAFGWGALHALSPGHGKGMVAAYLVGSRGTPRHAIALGATVTVTHTLGVFALGAVTLLLSQYVLPEQLYPWLNLASGLLILIIGGSVLRSRIHTQRRGRNARPPTHADSPGPQGRQRLIHAHAVLASQYGPPAALPREPAAKPERRAAHAHADGHHHTHADGHHHTHGGQPHSHEPPDHLSPRNLLAMGASAGLIPCPSALVVLLGALAQHQVALGILLIVAFSVGLAFTLSVLGLAVVWMGSLSSRVNFTSPLMTALPAASALLIVGVGCVLTARAIPQIMG